LAVLWPLAVLLLTPLIVLAGLVAVIGMVALGASRPMRIRGSSRSHRATVVRVESSPADIILSQLA
jgi:hypothetical protein